MQSVAPSPGPFPWTWWPSPLPVITLTPQGGLARMQVCPQLKGEFAEARPWLLLPAASWSLEQAGP